MMINKSTLIKALLLISLAPLAACTPKGITYMQDLDETVVTEITERREIRVRPEDKLSIVVNSKDPALANLFNLPIVSSRLGANLNAGSTSTRSYSSGNEGISAYTVDSKGDIDFPVLGTLHIEGMTRTEVAGFIKGELMGRRLVQDPIVTVEFLNTGFSVLGEVQRPGRYDLNRDHITILDAIALAGDLGIQGRRDNVLVVRDVNGKRQSYRIDLTNGKQTLKSPAYYLQQDDIIYVEPTDVRKRQTTNNGNTVLNASFWVSVASLLTSVLVLVVR